MIRRVAPSISLIAIALLAFVFSVSANDLDDVTIAGRLADSNGLAVVGATVTAVESTTGVERSAVTDGDGKYRFL